MARYQDDMGVPGRQGSHHARSEFAGTVPTPVVGHGASGRRAGRCRIMGRMGIADSVGTKRVSVVS